MIILNDEQAAELCDQYCRFPRKIRNQAEMEVICDRCPLSEGEQDERSDPD